MIGLVTRLLALLRTKAGSLNFARSIAYYVGELSYGVYTGTLHLTASLSRVGHRFVSKLGILHLTGSVRKLLALGKTQASDITPSGLLKRTKIQVSHAVDGALNFSKYLGRGAYRTYSSALNFAPALTVSARSIWYTATGTIYMAGEILRTFIVTNARSGILSFSKTLDGVKGIPGALEYVRTYLGSMSLGGVSYPAKNLTRSAVEGLLNLHGRITLIDAVIKRLSGTDLRLSGSLTYLASVTRRLLSSALNFERTIANVLSAKKTYSGILHLDGTATGTTEGKWLRTINGVISLGGILTRIVNTSLSTLSSNLRQSGILTRMANVSDSVSSSLSLVGDLIPIYTQRDWRFGYLGFEGATDGYFVGARSETSNLRMSSTLTRHSTHERINLKSNLRFSGYIPYKYKDILYFGPPNP